MDRERKREELKIAIEEYLKDKNIELVNLTFRHEGNSLVLRILADKPEGGITLEECALLNEAISLMLDEKGILQEKYILEVSSPGIDRPLLTRNDFSRCIYRNVKIFLKEPINGVWESEGTITGVTDTAVTIETDGESLEVPFSKINRAKQLI
ncbi:MAG: ribosome maturation factor RimP [Candidatus Omnitrophica bacterium]|nr:ribosome maturation factor RimP [Candidatus Omnitrophota bacterium]